ncbi:hypothetical protein [Thermostaphylospora chromogena]|uniref:Uncharacterized protein n=1 Tax=Thermostaphylospora chromogena TaxID=35622 RepID=A0A1H0XKI6_9ACTN|nr:hypothetical protein [Thermostaphylospora chromogena]SDQ03146.1 hypothetical protein SAMN04489764_0009 [Thermostaphylospora chromogena]SDQ03254.1 hypothetical protein SAMN04489764_0032 [Thermostaphylospora chromogena]SDQ03417.1 hypothetical protein SAMN04489764_0058 [Thermostaphylospora chromogena]
MRDVRPFKDDRHQQIRTALALCRFILWLIWMVLTDHDATH